MRVRTRRFESLRSRQPWNSQPIKVRNGQHRFEQPVTVAPPASTSRRHLPGHVLPRSQCLQFPIDRLGPLPVLELDGSEPMTQPLVQLAPDPGRLCHPEVGLPAQQVGPHSPCLAAPSMRFLSIGSRFTLHASFPRSVTLTQLRFTLLTVTSSQRDLHPQVCAHAGRTIKKPPPCRHSGGLVIQTL